MALQKGFMMTNEKRLPFASDYQQGAHPASLSVWLRRTWKLTPDTGWTLTARTRANSSVTHVMRHGQEVHFLVGGTQANAGNN
jgi:threonine aldolase